MEGTRIGPVSILGFSPTSIHLTLISCIWYIFWIWKWISVVVISTCLSPPYELNFASPPYPAESQNRLMLLCCVENYNLWWNLNLPVIRYNFPYLGLLRYLHVFWTADFEKIDEKCLGFISIFYAQLRFYCTVYPTILRQYCTIFIIFSKAENILKQTVIVPAGR